MSRRGPSLGRELDELERTDPTVAAARANYDRTVQCILAKTDLLAKAIRYLNQYHGEGVALPWHEQDAEVQALVDLLRPPDLVHRDIKPANMPQPALTFDDGHCNGRDVERAAVVRWLRKHASSYADRIENVEHVLDDLGHAHDQSEDPR